MSINFYPSIAGLNAFFKKMDVSANNVANLNTNNYKSRVAHIGQDKNGLPETNVTIDKTPGLEKPGKLVSQRVPRERCQMLIMPGKPSV